MQRYRKNLPTSILSFLGERSLGVGDLERLLSIGGRFNLIKIVTRS